MDAKVDVHEAKTRFSKLLERVIAGEEITTEKAGRPVARLVPIRPEQPARRALGIDKEKIWMAPDAFDPMTEAELAEWYDSPIDPPER